MSGPASPHGHTEVQPDNVTAVQLYLRGDEHQFYYEDTAGYAILRDEDGWLVYYNETTYGRQRRRHLVRGNQVPPGGKAAMDQRIKAGRDDPADFGIIPGQMPMQRIRLRKRRRKRKLTTDYRYVPTQLTRETRTTGRFTNLVILLRFADTTTDCHVDEQPHPGRQSCSHWIGILSLPGILVWTGGDSVQHHPMDSNRTDRKCVEQSQHFQKSSVASSESAQTTPPHRWAQLRRRYRPSQRIWRRARRKGLSHGCSA